MRDIKGRPYARLKRLKLGDIVQVDAGFTCLYPDELCEVHSDDHGLYVMCNGPFEGDECGPARTEKHYLDGQLSYRSNDGDSLVGVYKTRAAIQREFKNAQKAIA